MASDFVHVVEVTMGWHSKQREVWVPRAEEGRGAPMECRTIGRTY